MQDNFYARRKMKNTEANLPGITAGYSDAGYSDFDSKKVFIGSKAFRRYDV